DAVVVEIRLVCVGVDAAVVVHVVDPVVVGVAIAVVRRAVFVGVDRVGLEILVASLLRVGVAVFVGVVVVGVDAVLDQVEVGVERLGGVVADLVAVIDEVAVEVGDGVVEAERELVHGEQAVTIHIVVADVADAVLVQVLLAIVDDQVAVVRSVR